MSEPILRPPRLLERIVRRMSLYEDDFLWTRELGEEFQDRADRSGQGRARLWYLIQLLRALPQYTKYQAYWSFVMLKNYVITALRNIRRQKGFSLLNLSGLAVGITCFILISLYVQSELSYDRYHEGAGRIYRVCGEHPFEYHGRNQSAITPAPLAPALKADLPEVQSAVRFVDVDNALLSAGEHSFLEETIYFADPEIFEVFSFPLLTGNPAEVFSDPYSAVISERLAEKYYPDANPLGRTLRYNNQGDFLITGIMKNIPENSHFVADFIAPFKTYGIIQRVTFTSWSQFGYYTYLKLREDAGPVLLEGKLQTYLERSFGPGQSREGFRYFLQPLTKIHLHSDLIGEINPNHNIQNIYVFGVIAFLVLVIACIDYMNLATARLSQRSKEVGIRKVVGAQRKQVIRQFFGESLILAFLALVVSCLLAFFLLPTFSVFVGQNLVFDPIGNPRLLLQLAILLLFVGILAGSYPALVLSSLRPTAVLKGVLKRTRLGISLRNVLVMVQFAISILLIICTVTVKSQLSFIKNTDVGYAKDHIITMHVRDPEIRENIVPLKTELLNYPDILDVSTSSNLPHRITNIGRSKASDAADDAYFSMYQSRVDYDFLELFEIDLIAGRNFSRKFTSDEKEACILNEAAVLALGYSDPLGREVINSVHGGGQRRALIIGVMRDFNMLSLHQGISPLMLTLDPQESQRYLSIKTSGRDLSGTLGFIREKFASISSAFPYEYEFFDDVFYGVYVNERKVGQMFNGFGLLAVIIACLGLFGLAAFATEQRTKEIGIRKVLGASVSGIMTLLSREFAKLVIAANVFAWPAAYLVMNNWLGNFTYRISLGVGIFVLSACFALGLALVTVLSQALGAARKNPVVSLKYE
jgi:putative ABC transport system permease protein